MIRRNYIFALGIAAEILLPASCKRLKRKARPPAGGNAQNHIMKINFAVLKIIFTFVD